VPCDDISEVIDIQLDAEERLRDYRLNKRTCGAAVGQESLLLDLLAHRSVEEVLQLEASDVVARFPRMPQAEEFLYFKHFLAVQEALKVLSGLAEGGPGATCEASSIDAEGDNLRFVGTIAVDLMTDRIRACARCSSCSPKKPTIVHR